MAFSTFRHIPLALGQGLLDLIYPPSCILCHKAVTEPHGLCSNCWTNIRFITPPFCERLGLPFAFDHGGASLSLEAMADPPVFQKARAVCCYDEVAQGLVARLKYGDRLELAKTMSRLMIQAGHALLEDADVIIPVPMHRFRLWRRQFNQAMLLAELIAKHIGKPCPHSLLIRTRSTRSQVGLTRSQRAENLQGAFKVSAADKLMLEGKNVLLIDDVLTTGATANAASRALLKAGATKIDVLSFARVVKEG